MNETQNPENNLQETENESAETTTSSIEADARLSTAELQATLERLEALTNENGALRQAIEALEAEKEKLQDNWKRSEAEMANLRRRTEREITENAKYAVSSFARDVIGIGDNLRRAIEAVPKQAAANDPALATLVEGVEVTERELFKVLERQNIVRFDPVGEKFDPHVHEAMMRVETSEQPPETIVQVFQAGYMIGERVLRAAAVVVAKASTVASDPGPKNSAPVDAEPVDEQAASPANARTLDLGDALDDAADTPQKASRSDGGANVLRMQRRTSQEKGAAPARKAQIIRPVTVTTSVLSTKRPSSVTRPVMAQPNSDAPFASPGDPGYSEYESD